MNRVKKYMETMVVLPKQCLIVLSAALFMAVVSSCCPGHENDRYKLVILDKDSDIGTSFLCFGSVTKYYMEYKVLNADNKWHYYEHEVSRNVYRAYDVGDTLIRTHEQCIGCLGFVNNHDLGLCNENEKENVNF